MIDPQFHSKDSEQLLLGMLLKEPSFFLETMNIFGENSKIFFFQKHQLIFDAICFNYKNNIPIDWLSVKEVFENNNQLAAIEDGRYLIDLIEASILCNDIKHPSKIILEKYFNRELENACQEAISKIKTNQNQYDITQSLQTRISNLLTNNNTKKVQQLDEIIQKVWNEIEDRSECDDPLLGLDTGFHDLNYLTLGFQKSDLIIIAGRPSMGKTAFCLNIAENIVLKHKKPILLFSMEMSKEQLVQRLMSTNSGINSQKLRTGKNLSEFDWCKISNAVGDLSNLPFFIDDSPALTVMDIRSRVQQLQMQKKDLGLIVIDYLQLMRGGTDKKQSENRTQELSEISRGLKAIAKEAQVPVIALSQLSRNVESRINKRPMLSDLRESGAIEQDADIVMFLYRHEYYEPEDIESRGVSEIIISKQRNGETGIIKLLFHGQTTSFNNL